MHLSLVHFHHFCIASHPFIVFNATLFPHSTSLPRGCPAVYNVEKLDCTYQHRSSNRIQNMTNL